MIRKIFIILLFFIGTTVRSSELPKLTRYVNDFTWTLSQTEVNNLESMLKNYEDTTSNQIVILMISSLEGEDLNEFSHQVAEKNKIGQKGKDNGILILVVKNDRLIRIEVGYGLEGVVTDAIASTIIRNIVIPYFRSEKYYEGLRRGIETIQHAIAGLYTAEEKNNSKSSKIKSIVILILFMFILWLYFRIGRHSRGGWIYYGGGWHSIPRGRSSWGGIGSFGGGFGGGFGGFSGGGGSFGGGGASGRW